MLRTFALSFTLLAGLSSPAFATEWVSCVDPSGAASFDYLVGSGYVPAISSITISVGEKVWASDVANGPGDPVELGQSFQGNGMVFVDAVNDGALIAQLRLFVVDAPDLPVYGGTLSIPGVGAWNVSCTGP